MLTTADVNKLLAKPATGKKHSDGRSLHLWMRRDGAPCWVYQYRERGTGRQRTKMLGSAATMSPAVARKARDAFAVALQSGTASAGGSRRKRLVTAAADYLEHHKPEWSPKQYRDHGRRFEMYAEPLLGHKPVDRITLDDIAEMLRPIWTGPNIGKGSKLRAFLEWVFDAEEVAPNPAAWNRLKHKLAKTNAPTVGYPSLPWQELPALYTEIADDGSLPSRAVRFAILTAVRQKEAFGAKWGEIDVANRLWTIPADRMKARQEHVVPLSAAALALLGKPGKPDAYIFPSRRGGHLTNAVPGPFLAQFGRVDANGKPITLHGFRSTFSTWAREHQWPDDVTEFALAHAHGSKVARA